MLHFPFFFLSICLPTEMELPLHSNEVVVRLFSLSKISGIRLVKVVGRHFPLSKVSSSSFVNEENLSLGELLLSSTPS